MFDAPITYGVSLFLWIVCILAGLGAALTLIDMRTLFSGKEDTHEEEDPRHTVPQQEK